MLGSRTKQVNSYGRRGSRIVNASDRKDQESSEDADTPPFKKERAIMLSPVRVGHHKHKGLNRPQRGSPLTQNRDVATAKQMQSKLGSSTHVRQPLTPLRPNAASSSDHPLSVVKGKSKAFTVKPRRASLKPHTPAIAVDIMVLDQDGNMLTQEHRLSHTEIQANQPRTTSRKGKKTSEMPPSSSPPIVIGDDSDLEVVSPKVAKKRNRRPRAIVISSDDESEGDHKVKFAISPVKSHSKSDVEVVIPPVPSRSVKVAKRSPSPPLLPLAATPSQRSTLLAPRRLGPAAVPSHLASPLPVPKPRQLTPIRGLSSRSVFRRPPPPTPSTPTEADLSLDLAHLNLSDSTEIDGLTPVQPEYLVPLLNECAQTCPYEFSAFIETFPFDPIVQSSAKDEDAKFRKIGEASYSEVFGIGDVVLKVVPVQTKELLRSEIAEIPPPSDAEDVLKEIIVTREIGEICDKFVRLLKTYIVRGRYPSLLLDLWDEYNERKGSESIRPDSFGLAQVYAIIILPNGGPDLESYAFKNVSKSGWHQACGIFWQVARALEQAERLVNFEHRDLHWGQILVKNILPKKTAGKRSASRIAMDDASFGVEITIIDLGLSRMDAADAQGCKIYWTPLDNEIFEGEGDYQYDIYRMMRDFVGDVWKSYHPFTNVMWLHYLVTKLLHEKRLKFPCGKRQTGGEIRAMSPAGYDEQECYDCLVEMERVLGSCIASARKGQKGRRKTVAPTNGPRSARGVIAYGIRQGWVQ